jgi:hypothetical protein
VFNKTYKQAVPDNGHPLLRKAEHLEAIVNTARRENAAYSDNVKLATKCCTCQSEYSPFFHRVPEKGFECHRCRFKRKNEECFEWEKDKVTQSPKLKPLVDGATAAQ